jgi:hypothetical protein
MRWFRTHRRFAWTLALFALALQYTLAFGHIHLRDFAGIPGVAVQAQTIADAPADHHDGNRAADDYCLICSTTALAGTLTLPDLVALVVPVVSTEASYTDVCAAFCGRIDHAFFQARAPPLA